MAKKYMKKNAQYHFFEQIKKTANKSQWDITPHQSKCPLSKNLLERVYRKGNPLTLLVGM